MTTYRDDGLDPGGRSGQATDYDPELPPQAILTRHGARALEPTSSVVLEGQQPRNTAYVGNRLLLPPSLDHNDILRVLRQAAKPLRYNAYVTQQEQTSPFEGATVTFELGTGEVAPLPDAWVILQHARGNFGLDRLRGVGLDHLMFASLGVIGGTYHRATRRSDDGSGGGGAPRTQAAAISDYGRPGTGGRQPVAWLGPPPPRRRDIQRRPTVVILDNGCGRHPWLDPIVRHGLSLDGQQLGLAAPTTDPELSAARTVPPDDTEDAVAGHGTFAAGLVHMFCPDANIVAIRVVHPDGIALESDVVKVLGQLAELVRRHREDPHLGEPVDVVVLSMGYYHETADDSVRDGALGSVLEDLGRMGVVVVAAAGNDATTRPALPAAFAGWPLDPLTAPVVSVGATNPDGSIALFSNTGAWVVAWEAGASVVSTMPTTFGSPAGTAAGTQGQGRSRAPLDPNDYGAGFAVWSGTSFAAPVLAGKLAQLFIERMVDGVDLGTPERAWSAVTKSTGLRP